ncbi:hypothetical protein RHMOL_Rhmol04G0214400 [Rhododendron molle]|uniref:Uncharacterized protein n=1 Tax=Rhododendron molle TaxID=49168 RepID=A0ACC0P2Q6_RHOML|nr:hypothetical protein RHMOL_Rhmol04G0214400 [Rhododendron molle]
MANHGNGSGEEDVVDRPEDEGGPMEVEIKDQPTTEEATGVGAMIVGGEDVTSDAEIVTIQPLDPFTSVEGVVISGEDFSGAGGSGARDGGVRSSGGSFMRNPTHKKDPIVVEEEEEARNIRAEDVMFQPAAQLLTHMPITQEDYVEYLSDKRLARLLEEHPEVGIAVLLAREERQREVLAAEAAARAEREIADGEEALRDMEAVERAKAA